MISPQKTKSPCFQPRFLNSGLDLRIPSYCRQPNFPALFSFEPVGHEPNCNRCLIILIMIQTGWFGIAN